MKNIILIASAGAGKGVQSTKLVNKYGYEHISTGSILREEIENKTKDAELISGYINNGNLIPDELMYEILLKKLKKLISENKSFILDGFPRNLDQAIKYDEIVKELNIDLGIVIVLDLPKEEAMKRVLGRMECPTCGRMYNKYIDSWKPKEENICDNCKCKLVIRDDDTKEAFEERYNIFLKNSNKIIKYYEENYKNIVYRINANRSAEDIFKDIENILEG